MKEIRDEVLSRAGRFRQVVPRSPGGASLLKVKEVVVEDRRYVLCLNEDEAAKDAADREAILATLEERLRREPSKLIGNRGFRRYLKLSGKSVSIDTERVEAEARYDGKWVLVTNTDYEADEVAVAYKQLWMVEDIFRTMKAQLATRLVYHRTAEAIRGHVFCSFLALVLRAELEDRLAQEGPRGSRVGPDPPRPRPPRGGGDREARHPLRAAYRDPGSCRQGPASGRCGASTHRQARRMTAAR